MGDISRRAIIGAGLIAIPTLSSANTIKEPEWLTLKNITIDAVDEKARTISMTLSKIAKSATIVGLPAAKDIGVRVSNKLPGVANNLPFTWDRVRKLVGVLVSVQFRIGEEGLEVATIASAND